MGDIGLPTEEKGIVANAMNWFISWFLIAGLFFGILFYDFIDKRIGFSYIDEILAFSLCLFTLFAIIHVPNRKFESYWFWLFGIFTFYIIYSFAIHSNTKSAIMQDAIVQLKPFLGFFCAYSLRIELSSKQKRIIRYFCFFALFLLLLTTPDMFYFMGHPTRYATAATFISMLYLYVSDFTKKNLAVTIAILFVAIFSGKAKAFGFFSFFSILAILFYNRVRLKLSLRTLLIFIAITAVAVAAAWEKVYFYFIYGTANMGSDSVEYAFARPALYWGAWQILLDYFPFGSGFASFATFFSADPYSPIYYQYNLNIVYGLAEDEPNFMADTYFPSLAQYGLIGVALFSYFWFYILKTAAKNKLGDAMESVKMHLLVVGGVIFFAIESVADSTLTHNRGLFMMIMVGLALSNMQMKKMG